MEINVGDHFTVKVNGIDYDTVIDEHDVQRFVGNPIVAAYVTASGETYNKWLVENPIETRNWDEAPFTLNDIDYTPNGTYTTDQLIEFSTLHGYSVAGMCDLPFMAGVEVINPLWEDDETITGTKDEAALLADPATAPVISKRQNNEYMFIAFVIIAFIISRAELTVLRDAVLIIFCTLPLFMIPTMTRIRREKKLASTASIIGH